MGEVASKEETSERGTADGKGSGETSSSLKSAADTNDGKALERIGTTIPTIVTSAVDTSEKHESMPASGRDSSSERREGACNEKRSKLEQTTASKSHVQQSDDYKSIESSLGKTGFLDGKGEEYVTSAPSYEKQGSSVQSVQGLGHITSGPRTADATGPGETSSNLKIVAGTNDEKTVETEEITSATSVASAPDSTSGGDSSSALALVERRLLGIVDSNSGSVLLSRIPQDYESTFSSKLDHKELGFPKLLDLIASFPALEAVYGNKTVYLQRAFSTRPSKKKKTVLRQMSSVADEEVSDLCAAVECLQILKQNVAPNSWPKTSVPVNKFLRDQTPATAPKLANWVNQRRDEGLGIGQIRKRLTEQLTKMRCVSKVKKLYTWHQKEIDAILSSRDSSGSDQYLTNCSRSVAESLTCPTSSNVQVNDVKIDTLKSDLSDIQLIETTTQLEGLNDLPPFLHPSVAATGNSDMPVVAVDCEGVPEELFFIQVATITKTTYIFDCVKLGAKTVCEFLRNLLSDSRCVKLFHDLHNDALALSDIGGIKPLRGTLDTQLAVESLTGHPCMGFNLMLKELGQKQHDSKASMKRRMRNEQLFSQRPIPLDVLQYAADDVRLLIDAYESLCAMLGNTSWDSIRRASDARALSAAENTGMRRVCFDISNAYAISSFELLQEQRPNDILVPTPLKVSNEASTLLDMLPTDLAGTLHERAHLLSDVVLDKGRRPHAWVGGDRMMLGDSDRLVELAEIAAIVDKLGGFGTDNRAGLERQLHRISAIRNRESDIIGLTLRFGRHVSGNTGIISDLLFGDATKSILFLGEPGSGKTTVVREVTRLLAEHANVCIVDTSNEIAGDGDVPHPCVGYARRMMVPSLDQQSAVMIECVQNHTPEVMVIDEIGRPTEVEASRTCKNRGVRLIASAHGDLRKLIKNPKLRGLIGGVESVTLGDAQAKEEARRRGGSIQKTKAERAGPPTFEILVELRRGAHHEWRIVLDSAEAVDKVLQGEAYKAQRRIRDPLTGAVCLDFELG